jgi:hypothetical protein
VRLIDAGSIPRAAGIADTCTWSAKTKAPKAEAVPRTPKRRLGLERILRTPIHHPGAVGSFGEAKGSRVMDIFSGNPGKCLT